MRFFIDELRYFAILLMAMWASACSDDDSVLTTASLSVDTISGRTTQCAVVLTAQQGTSYTVSIISDDEWCHFSSSRLVVEGEMGADCHKSLFVYFDENFTEEQGRRATIEVDFADGNYFSLVLTQRWADPTLAFERDWAELPVCYKDDNYRYVSHGGITVGRRSNQRNFTLCFDVEHRLAQWVAYPLHSDHTQKNTERTDAWAYDPSLPTNIQPQLFSSYYGRYDRGHQLPSADRLCSYAANAATFYFSNMTPQQSDFNQGLWGNLEGKVRGKMCADTLYVVTGCHFNGEHDSSIAASTNDRAGNTCPIPTHYYKLLLRTVKGNTGKAISEITDADELQAVAIQIHHHNSGGDNTLDDEWFMSINELEQITGFDFFPMLDDAIEEQVEAQCNRSKWF